MAKSLKNILNGTKSSKTSPADVSDFEKSKDGNKFAGKHEIEKHADRVGNDKEPYTGKSEHYVLNSKKEKRHGYMSGADQKVYEAAKMTCESCGKMYEGESCGCNGKSVKAAVPGGGKGMITDKKKINEVLTKRTPASKVIDDFVHSDNKMFSGDSKQERIKRALGAYYGMHPEKKKVNEEPDFEYEMARNELETASRAIERLMKHLKGEGQLEAWVQSKITKGSDYLDTVADYMDSLKEELAMPMLESGKKKKKKTEGESAPFNTYGAAFSSNGPDGRV